MTKEMVHAASSSFAPSTQRAQSLKPACVTDSLSVSRLLLDQKGANRTCLRGWGRQGEEMHLGPECLSRTPTTRWWDCRLREPSWKV